jgi:predicted alpha/beta-fold hydrolase
MSRSALFRLADVPEFRPHPLLRGAHLQTIFGNGVQGRPTPYQAERHIVAVSDGDAVVLHDDRPDDWTEGGRVALLVHGLAGSHRSGYLARTAHKLNAAGVRTFRMDLRAAGDGADLARLPYHPGRSEDALAAIARVARLCPGSPIVFVAFSLGGNLVLKALGEIAERLPGSLDGSITVNPAADLTACSAALGRWRNRLYDRRFVRQLWRQVRLRPRLVMPPDLADPRWWPRSVRELDARYTSVVCGFGSVEAYYERCSALPWLHRVRVPSLLVVAEDDPIVPVEIFDRLPENPHLHIHRTGRGGHLGFLSRRGSDADNRWVEWRIVEWVRAVPLLQAAPGSAPISAPQSAGQAA